MAFKFVHDFNWDFDISSRSLKQKPAPKLWHAGNGVIGVVCCDQNIRVKKIEQLSTPSRSAFSENEGFDVPGFHPE